MTSKAREISKKIPKQAKKQNVQPGKEYKLTPKDQVANPNYIGSGKLKDRIAIITGGDSGIGHATAILFAKEGADVVIAYLNEHKDAKKTKADVEALGRQCLLISGDLSKPEICNKVVKKTLATFGKINILVNNIAEQHPQKNFLDITPKQLIKTFNTNIFSFFFMIRAVLPHLKKGSAIINTTSITCYKGNAHLIDYSSTKGAILALTRSLSAALAEKGIRVNGVAPGPIWTPLIVSTFEKSHIKEFGKNVPMKRPGQPSEVAPCYVFLASDDSSYMTGQVLHPNGGEVVNG